MTTEVVAPTTRAYPSCDGCKKTTTFMRWACAKCGQSLCTDCWPDLVFQECCKKEICSDCLNGKECNVCLIQCCPLCGFGPCFACESKVFRNNHLCKSCHLECKRCARAVCARHAKQHPRDASKKIKKFAHCLECEVVYQEQLKTERSQMRPLKRKIK